MTTKMKRIWCKKLMLLLDRDKEAYQLNVQSIYILQGGLDLTSSAGKWAVNVFNTVVQAGITQAMHNPQ